MGLMNCQCGQDPLEEPPPEIECGDTDFISSSIFATALCCDGWNNPPDYLGGLLIKTLEQPDEPERVSSALIDSGTNAIWLPKQRIVGSIYGPDDHAFSSTDADFDKQWDLSESDAAAASPGAAITGSLATVHTTTFLGDATNATISIGRSYPSGPLAVRITAYCSLDVRTSMTGLGESSSADDGVEARLFIEFSGTPMPATITYLGAYDQMRKPEGQDTMILRHQSWRTLYNVASIPGDNLFVNVYVQVQKLGTNNGKVVGMRNLWVQAELN